MYFFLLTNDSNYAVFDENLAILDRLKKGSNKNQKMNNIPKAAYR